MKSSLMQGRSVLANEYVVKVALNLYDGMVIRARAKRVTNNDLACAASIGKLFTPGRVSGYGWVLAQINQQWKIATPMLIKATVSDRSAANLIMDSTGCDHTFEVSFVGIHNGYAISEVLQHTIMISRIM